MLRIENLSNIWFRNSATISSFSLPKSKMPRFESVDRGVYDLSPAIDLDGFEWWPGLTLKRKPFAWNGQPMTLEAGCSCRVDVVESMPMHVGPHADAPSHYLRDGTRIDQIDPSIFIGTCQVLHADVNRGDRITPDTLTLPTRLPPRVLIRSDTFFCEGVTNSDYAVPTPELVIALAERGARLIGVDVLSMDAVDSRELPTHHEIGRRGLAILEWLDLRGVPEGIYVLSAAPLKLCGDAAMVRPVLFRPTHIESIARSARDWSEAP